ncbi:UNVERIFIED_ORG: DNA-directed RNA polymerase specialized sigma24 family protein [Actinomadura viridilutea]
MWSNKSDLVELAVKVSASTYLAGMDDHLLVEALRERDPAAPAAAYDAYAERLYGYCWFHLRDRDAAQVALRDTFIVAEAHIRRLRDADRFGPWLYAIARLECARRPSAPDQRPDVPVASHDQDDVDLRVVAWQAVEALDPLSRDLLELRVRQRLPTPDVAAVAGLSLKDAEAQLERAHAALEAALTAELLAHDGPYGCPERGALLRQRRGAARGDVDRRLARHARECGVCRTLRPRTVSAAKVYGLLPQARPPASLREQVMSCFFDPELVGYRLFVATRVGEFGPTGFPVQSRHAARRRGLRPAARRPPYALFGGLGGAAWRGVAAVAVVALLLGGGGVAFHRLVGADGQGGGTAVGPSVPLPTVGTPPQGDRGDAGEAPPPATYPLGARVSSAPPTALPWPPSGGARPAGFEGARRRGAALTVAPLFLDLAEGSHGTLQLTAEGGPVTWRAEPWGPVRLSRTSGRIEAGQTLTLGVDVARRGDAAGEGGVVFEPGGVEVRITWRPVSRPDPTSPPPGQQPTTPPPQTSRPPQTSPPPSSPSPPSTPPSEQPSSDPPSSSPPPSREPGSASPSGESPRPEGSGG